MQSSSPTPAAGTHASVIHATLDTLRTGRALTERQSQEAFELILTGQMDAAQIASFLTLIAARSPSAPGGLPGGMAAGALGREEGPSVDELVGGARVMRRYVARVPLPVSNAASFGAIPTLVDTCGTGGAPKTFNVSTAVAFVLAAASPSKGRRAIVAKHGSTSRTGRGSAEVLRELGVNIDAPASVQSRCLEDLGVCFCFSVHHHPAMAHAAPVRRSLGFPTIFNLLGPLTNPAGANRQLIGAFSPSLANRLAHTLARLGGEGAHAMVVHSHDGLDELSISETSEVHQVRAGRVETRIIDPASLGLKTAPREAVSVQTLAEAAAAVREVLEGTTGARLDMTLLNAAGALIVADMADDFAEGLELAREAVASGRAKRVLGRLTALTNASA